MTLNGQPVVGFGQVEVVAPAAVAATSPAWGTVLATSVVSAITGLVVEEVVRSVRKKRRQR
jgi:tetrahydromethanopterin S-methyltransferase subunit C